jgi:hypothetical protein
VIAVMFNNIGAETEVDQAIPDENALAVLVVHTLCTGSMPSLCPFCCHPWHGTWN